MVFSEEEIIAVLKKALPKTSYKDLEEAARCIITEAGRWQEVDLNRHAHDNVEIKILHDLCLRQSSNNKPPQNVRLFFKG